jgi:hypothetical protein
MQDELQQQVAEHQGPDSEQQQQQQQKREDQHKQWSYLYDLTAVVQHLGFSQSSGHYIVYRRVTQQQQQQQQQCSACRGSCCSGTGHNSSNHSLFPASSLCDSNSLASCRWFRVNDSKVAEVDAREVLQCHATLLVYERRSR